MEKEFRPIYKKENMIAWEKKDLIDVILGLERDTHNLQNEIRSILDEWRDTIKLLKK